MKYISPLLFLLGTTFFFQSCKENTGTKESTSGPAVDSTYYQEKYRPQFHFSPPQKWTNDPNGMVFYEGEYHLFYQHYPDSTVWGPMHWGHAVSRDLTHWENLPIALYPDSMGYIFSGSAVVDWKNTSGFGEGGKPPLIAMYTIHDMAREKLGTNDHESQGIAWSNDRGRTWTKYSENPVIPNPGKIKDIRDPKLIWDNDRNQWVVTLAVGNHAEFWSSPDLKKWKKLSEFGHNLGNHNGVWECPDLFPLAVEGTGETKWVLIININPGNPNGGSGTQYFVGTFDGTSFTPDAAFLPFVSKGKAVWLDGGKDNYAGVTWSDAPDNRRLLIGWMSNWQYANKVPTIEWRNAMTIPWELSLRKTDVGYRISTKPVPELKGLRASTADIPSNTFTDSLDLSGTLGLSTPLLELELEFEMPAGAKGSFGVELSNTKGESYRIGFDTDGGHYFSDRLNAGDASFSEHFATQISTTSRSSTEKTIKMHLYFDVASAELFADDGANVMTEIFFPSENFSNVKLFADGGQANLISGKAHQLKSIWK